MTTHRKPCSEPAASGRLTVLEGMPGTGKTTAARTLAQQGARVIGEYVTPAGATLAMADHPPVPDDAGHQRNWRIKHHLAATASRTGPVYSDRDWLSALAYAASIDDGGQLLRERCAWASGELAAGQLAVADDYVVFHLDPDTSLARRSGRLTPDHPWSLPAALHRLSAFYIDPPLAISGIRPSLAASLSAARWHHLNQPGPGETLRFLRDLADASPPADLP